MRREKEFLCADILIDTTGTPYSGANANGVRSIPTIQNNYPELALTIFDLKLSKSSRFFEWWSQATVFGWGQKGQLPTSLVVLPT